MTKTDKTRDCFTRDSKWLRRARAHFCGLLRRWAEKAKDPAKYRERVWAIAEAMGKHRLLSSHGQTHNGACSVLSQWARADKMKWWSWIMRDKRRNAARMYASEFRRWHDTQHKDVG